MRAGFGVIEAFACPSRSPTSVGGYPILLIDWRESDGGRESVYLSRQSFLLSRAAVCMDHPTLILQETHTQIATELPLSDRTYYSLLDDFRTAVTMAAVQLGILKVF